MTCMTEADKPVTTSSGRFMREPTKKPADHSHQAARSRKLVKMTNGQLEVRAWRSPCQRLTSKPACFGASAMEISGLRNPKLCWRHAWMVSCNLTLWRSLKRQGKLHLRKRKGGSSRRTRAKKDISFHCCFQSFDIMIPHDTVISFIHADPTWGENAEAHEEPAVADHQPQAAEGWTPHDMVHGTVYPAHDVRQPGSGWCEFSTSTWMNMERSMWKKGRWLEDVFISFSCWLSNLPLSAHLIAPNLTAVLIPRGHKPVLAFSLADAEAQVEEMIAEVDGLDFSDPIWVYMGQVLDNFPELQTRLIRRMGAVEDGDSVPYIMHMGHIKYSHHLQCLSYIMMAKFQQNFRSSTCRSFNSSFVWASTAGGSWSGLATMSPPRLQNGWMTPPTSSCQSRPSASCWGTCIPTRPGIGTGPLM